MRVAFIDFSERSFVGLTWRIGAKVFAPFFDRVYHVRSVEDVYTQLHALLHDGIELTHVQVWGHGGPGAPLIAREPIDPLEPSLDALEGAEVWFRSCSVLRGNAGISFAKTLADRRISVAGHLAVIGPWACQSFLVGVRAGHTPWWSPDFDGKTSAPWLPRTVTAFRTTLPKWTWTSDPKQIPERT